MTVANGVTASRLLTVPCMLFSAWSQRPALFVSLLAYACLSDVLDGPIARLLHQASPLGARLDSVADAAVYLTAPIAVLLLYPRLREREWLTVFVILAAYVVPIVVGYVKYRRLTAYHTLAARTAGVLLVASFLLFLTLGVTWPIRIAVAVLVVSAVEELALTAMLPAWRANVRSFLNVSRS
ncbi:MAG TPA: CDP-alcohol phosphatidyltransferase family protein [Gemmatimonadaceae bacterium]|nr:CDP-alcohol phosphatidyltransferase family protein [Gemmatimonadaceae bacterium]